MKILISELRQKVIETIKQNFTTDEAIRIADYIIWAEMSGISTQGLIKMTGPWAIHKIKPKYDVKIERDTKLSQLIDAGANPAPLVSQLATDVVIEKAKDHGFAIVGVHNTYSSNGAQAYYAERIAKADLIGIVMARSIAVVAPFDSIDNLFGTNPICFSFPTNNEPLVFDMATSAITFYGLLAAKAKGEKIPENIAIDKNGNPTTDPESAINGAILPFDRGYKGSGLGMVVEILAGPLAASAYCDHETLDKEWGSTFIAIDPELLVDISKFKNECSDLISIVKNSRKKQDAKEVRIPGEQAKYKYLEANKSGYVDVEESYLKELAYI